MKKVIIVSSLICLFLSGGFVKAEIADMPEDSYGERVCSATNEKVDLKEIVSVYEDEDGDLIHQFADGVTVEYCENGDIYIRDANNVLNADLDTLPIVENELARGAGSLIGRAVIDALGACQAIAYVSGVDVCRILLSYLASPAPNTTYGVYAFREPHHIAGCYPSSSPQCIEYTVTYKCVVMN